MLIHSDDDKLFDGFLLVLVKQHAALPSPDISYHSTPVKIRRTLFIATFSRNFCR